MLKNTEKFWGESWKRHFNNYISVVPRTSYYINFLLEFSDQKILEIGAGSFRDTNRLNEWGYDAYGVDFSKEAVNMAKSSFPFYKDKFICTDAKKMPFKDKMFSCSFHNGLYIYFENDVLKELIKEQIRVTERLLICIVHNIYNQQLVNDFKKRSLKDDLYNIRFFTEEEMIELIGPYCSKMEVLPFGIFIDKFFDKRINRNMLKWLYQGIKRFNLNNHSERLMFVGYLK